MRPVDPSDEEIAGMNGAHGVNGAGRLPPNSSEAEEYILSAMMLDGAAVVDAVRTAGLGPSSFFNSKHELACEAIFDLHATKQPTEAANVAEWLKARRRLNEVGGYGFITQISGVIPTTAMTSVMIERVREQAVLREIIRAADRAREECYNFTTGGINEFAAEISRRIAIVAAGAAPKKSLRGQLLARAFNEANPPTEPVPRFLINGKPVCTPGNLTNIIAQSKSGKSAYVGAAIASAIAAWRNSTDRDTLGITAENPDKRILLHLDTEQAIYDHHKLVGVSIRRAGGDGAPPWLQSFALAGFSADQLRAGLLIFIEEFATSGFYAIILDGSADFLNDVNDPKEANGFVAELHNLAIENDCPIISVVHENPTHDTGKMRGHFGSQLERKAESNIRLKKTENITIVFSDKMRRAPILEKDGPRFSWDDAAGMHLSCAESLGDVRDQAKRERLRDMMEAVVAHAGRDKLRYAELLKAISEVARIGASTAEDRFTQSKKLGVIAKDLLGFWSITP